MRGKKPAEVEIGAADLVVTTGRHSTVPDVKPHLLNSTSDALDLSTDRTHPCLPTALLNKLTYCTYEARAGISEWETVLAAILPDVDVRALSALGRALLGRQCHRARPRTIPVAAGLDVAAVKRLTGGGTIGARELRNDFIEFTPSHLPFLITNHLPRVLSDDPACGPC